MRLIVDADACPVKEIVFTVAREFQIPVVLVCSIAHAMPENEISEIRWVERRPQAADIEIINLSQPEDIIITGDYGLASLVIGKGCRAISFRGMVYHKDRMDALLEQRYQSQKIRDAGGRTKGPSRFLEKDEIQFDNSLRKMIQS